MKKVLLLGLLLLFGAFAYSQSDSTVVVPDSLEMNWELGDAIFDCEPCYQTAELLNLLAHFGCCWNCDDCADINDDGHVTTADLTALLGMYCNQGDGENEVVLEEAVALYIEVESTKGTEQFLIVTEKTVKAKLDEISDAGELGKYRLNTRQTTLPKKIYEDGRIVIVVVDEYGETLKFDIGGNRLD